LAPQDWQVKPSRLNTALRHFANGAAKVSRSVVETPPFQAKWFGPRILA
jgi:hypothetical protein